MINEKEERKHIIVKNSVRRELKVRASKVDKTIGDYLEILLKESDDSNE